MDGTGRAATEGEAEFVGAAVAVVAICFAMNMISRGVSETFAVFLPAIEAETGWSRSMLSGVGAIYMAAHGLAAPIAGAAFDRYGPRAVYVVGLSFYGGGYLLASQAGAFWQAAACLGLMIGIGVAATGMAAASALVGRWFDRRLSLALGFAYAGLSVGMIVMAPLSERLIAAIGWRGAYQWFGLVLLALIPALLLLPWSRLERGAPGRGTEIGAASGRARSMFVSRRVLTLAPFWGLFNVFFFTSVAIWGVMLQAVAFLTSIGFSPLQAATAYGFVGSMSVGGIIMTGWLADRYGRRLVVSLSYALTVVGVGMLWALSVAPSIALLIGFVIVFGITMGARGPVVSTLVARLFPGNVGAVYGAITIGLGFGAATGAWLSGLLYDLTGGYDAVFAMSILAALVGVAQFWIIRPLAEGRWPDGASPTAASPQTFGGGDV